MTYKYTKKTPKRQVFRPLLHPFVLPFALPCITMIFDASVHKKTFRFPEFLPYRCQKYPTCKEGSDARCYRIVNPTISLPIANTTSRVGAYKNFYPISAKMYAQYTKKAELTWARLQLYEVNPKKIRPNYLHELPSLLLD